MKLASSYNWDQTSAASTAAPLDPNSDEFFNSMLADDKKVTTGWPQKANFMENVTTTKL